MKKIIYIFLAILSLAMFSCGGNSDGNNNESKQNDSIVNAQEADSLATLIQTLDSISNSGSLVHYDIYKIGKLKGIDVSVQKVTVDTTQISYINLRKDCGGEYYYSWEDAMIFSKELPSFYSAVATIKNNLGRTVDHEERFAYVTKDNIALLASCENGNNWTTRFSVDSHKSNSVINLSASEIGTMLNLIKQAEAKLNEIK